MPSPLHYASKLVWRRMRIEIAEESELSSPAALNAIRSTAVPCWAHPRSDVGVRNPPQNGFEAGEVLEALEAESQLQAVGVLPNIGSDGHQG